MSVVDIGENGFTVDAQVVANAFDLHPSEVLPAMKSGVLTSLCEKGVDADEGRWRLTFYHAGRALRLTVDANGQILSQSSFDVPRGGA